VYTDEVYIYIIVYMYIYIYNYICHIYTSIYMVLLILAKSRSKLIRPREHSIGRLLTNKIVNCIYRFVRNLSVACSRQQTAALNKTPNN
jgi:hypothetical protein